MSQSPGNLDRLRAALDELEAEPVFFPLLSAAVLRRGHACHFRLRAADLHGLRVDVMSTMRGVDSFGKLWKRRAGGGPCPTRSGEGQEDSARQGLADDPSIDRSRRRPRAVKGLGHARSILAPGMSKLRAAITGDEEQAAALLKQEEDRERQQDKLYWAPLRSELERWRRTRPR